MAYFKTLSLFNWKWGHSETMQTV